MTNDEAQQDVCIQMKSIYLLLTKVYEVLQVNVVSIVNDGVVDHFCHFVASLNRAIKKKATVKSMHKKRIYRPVICCVNKFLSRKIQLYITFYNHEPFGEKYIIWKQSV